VKAPLLKAREIPGAHHLRIVEKVDAALGR
jgi:hypothetical protein